MEQRLYLGATELIFHTDEELVLQQWDAKFLEPVMDIGFRVNIYLNMVSDLPLPAGDSILLRGSRMWYTDKGSYRLYDARKGSEPYILSHCVDDSTVILYVRKDEWETRKQSFRPWFYIHLEELLLAKQALVLHSASIVWQRKAILFTAPSGTGKTTQTDLWHRFREGVEDLNGDRTLLQKTADGWYGCGFPVFGSTVRCEQTAASLGAIVIIRQAPEDKVWDLSLMEKISWLYTETTVLSQDSGVVEASMDLIEDLARQVKVVRLDCTMNESAVDTLEHAIFGE